MFYFEIIFNLVTSIPLNQPNCSWPWESSSGFSPLWPGVFYIPLQVRKAQLRGWKKRTNEQTRTRSAPSARSGEVYETPFGHSVFLLANASVYSSENAHEATSNADLTSRVVGLQVLAAAFLTSVDWSPLCPTLISWLTFSWHERNKIRSKIVSVKMINHIQRNHQKTIQEDFDLLVKQNIQKLNS